MFALMRRHLLLALSVVMMLGGGALAWLVQTQGGAIDVRDVRFTGESGATLSGLLYVPVGVSGDNPAPGVLAVHGYINSRETQSAYAIELARRGYVVLAMDQRGHGYSDPPAFAEGFGGPAGLAWLRSLDMVDRDQIALAGHSMGGWTVLSAAALTPDAYSSVVVSGSSTGTFGVPAGDAAFPRNFGLVFGRYDEFSSTMWGSPTGAGIVETDKLKTQFGVAETVQPERLYGSIEAGTARLLYQPAQTHPANHITRSGVAGVLDWVQRTTAPPAYIDPADQVWPWKELGTLLSLIGAFTFIVAVGGVFMEVPVFAEVAAAPAPAAGIPGRSWWLAAAIVVAIPLFTYFPLQGWAANIPTTALFAQNLTNGFVVWALGVGLISLALFLAWHFLLGGKAGGGNPRSYGLSWAEGFSLRKLLLSVAVGGLAVLTLYLMLAVNHFFFTADFRFWVVAVKLMNSLQLQLFLGYLLPFTFFFLVFGVVLHGQMRASGDQNLARKIVVNACLGGLGIAILLLFQYGLLFIIGRLAIPEQALLTIVAIQFAVLLPVTSVISTVYFQRTGEVYTGAVVNGLLITWIIVAGQATHFAF